MIEIEIRQAQGTRWMLVEKQEIVIGRSGGARPVDVDLAPDESVSRVHARVFITHGAAFIEDLKSSLGTAVNGDPLNQVRALHAEDLVQVGETVLRFIAKPASEQEIVKHPVVRSGSPAQPAGNLKLAFEVQFKGKRSAVVVGKTEAFIGRKHPERVIDVDLTEDASVSRVHARVWWDNGEMWIEDKGSRHGTQVNGQVIPGPAKISKTDKVQIGETHLQVQQLLASAAPIRRGAPPKAPLETSPLSASPTSTAVSADGPCPVFKVEAFLSLAPSAPAGQGQPLGHIRVEHRFACDAEPEINTISKRKTVDFYRAMLLVPREMGALADFDALCAFVADRLVKTLPGTERSALYLVDAAQRRLVLKAHVPGLKPILSDVLAREVLSKPQGIIWKQSSNKEQSPSGLPAQWGMYAPIFSGKEPFGLLSVDTAQKDAEYALEDLCFFVQYAQVMGSFLRGRKPS